MKLQFMCLLKLGFRLNRLQPVTFRQNMLDNSHLYKAWPAVIVLFEFLHHLPIGNNFPSMMSLIDLSSFIREIHPSVEVPRSLSVWTFALDLSLFRVYLDQLVQLKDHTSFRHQFSELAEIFAHFSSNPILEARFTLLKSNIINHSLRYIEGSPNTNAQIASFMVYSALVDVPELKKLFEAEQFRTWFHHVKSICRVQLNSKFDVLALTCYNLGYTLRYSSNLENPKALEQNFELNIYKSSDIKLDKQALEVFSAQCQRKSLDETVTPLVSMPVIDAVLTLFTNVGWNFSPEHTDETRSELVKHASSTPTNATSYQAPPKVSALFMPSLHSAKRKPDTLDKSTLTSPAGKKNRFLDA